MVYLAIWLACSLVGLVVALALVRDVLRDVAAIKARPDRASDWRMNLLARSHVRQESMLTIQMLIAILIGVDVAFGWLDYLIAPLLIMVLAIPVVAGILRYRARHALLAEAEPPSRSPPGER